MAAIAQLFSLLSALLLTSCANNSTPAIQTKPVVIYAASSLTEVFAELSEDFEHSHPNVDVQLTFAGSQVLRLQIEQGATVDLFASANTDHIQALVDAQLIATSQVFTENEIVVIVPSQNPNNIVDFDDLSTASRIVIGTKNSPIGAYTHAVLESARNQFGDPFVAHIRAHIVSEESNTRLVRTKIALGEADAAFVYKTDAIADGLRSIPIPESINVRAQYPIGTIANASHPVEAAAFVDFISSQQGRRVLQQHGFRSVQE